MRSSQRETETTSSSALYCGVVTISIASRGRRWNRGDDFDIYVFNLDDIHSDDDLKRFMPGVPLPTKTPVLAVYVEGAVQRWGDGSAATELILSYLPH
jgi:hypothetical protein